MPRQIPSGEDGEGGIALLSGDAQPAPRKAPPASPLAAALASQWLADVKAFLTTIAVLLGIGILGLPLQLVDCGFAPFVVTLTVTLLMQLAVVVLTTELLQRAHAHLAEGGGSGGSGGGGGGGGGTADLHTMGALYLAAPAARAFDLSVIVVFVSTLISYGLAGSGAFGSLLGVPAVEVTVPFILACAGLVIFASRLVQPLVSALTFVKVSVLVVVIGLCGLVARQTGLRPHESWQSVMQPFLVGTVAIGGIADLMPVMLDERARASATGLRHFRASVGLGVVACWLLNLLWASFVLGIVPQRRSDAAADGVSLEDAAARGEIATIPVTQIVNQRFEGQYGWLARAITVFIVLSISVSFNAIGLGFKHVLSGMAASLCERLGLPVERDAGGAGEVAAAAVAAQAGDHGGSGAGADADADADADAVAVADADADADADAGAGAARKPWRSRAAARAVHYVLYFGSFGAVLVVAIYNPHGFLVLLGSVTSLALNLAGGVFVALMYVAARRRPLSRPLLLPLHEGVGRALAACVLVTFSVAVLYDAHQSAAAALGAGPAAGIVGAAAAVACGLLVPAARYVVLGT